MFNKTILLSRENAHHDHRHESHEHRAATDESVRLLTEMERKAEERIISVNRLKNNVIDAIWYVKEEPMNMRLIVTCKLKINGKDHEFTTEAERPWKRGQEREIVRQICETLATELMKMCFAQTQFATLLTRG